MFGITSHQRLESFVEQRGKSTKKGNIEKTVSEARNSQLVGKEN
jgi:hypothetical protein